MQARTIFPTAILLVIVGCTGQAVPPAPEPPVATVIPSSTAAPVNSPTTLPLASHPPAPVSPSPLPARTAPPAATAVSSKPFNWITAYNPMPHPAMAKPNVGAPFVDPNFKTTLVRITDARTMRYAGLVPDYAKRQAWNADESLLLLRTGDGYTLLFDGSTYQFIKVLEGVEGEDVFWHPTNRELILYNPENALYSYNVRTDEKAKLSTFSDYAFANTRGEGNLSRDARYYAFAGQLYNAASGEVTFKDLVVFDLETRRVTAKLALPKLQDFDWVSISPLGNYVVVDYADTETARYHGIEVYDRNFKFLWQKPVGPGHSDLTVDVNGDEVLVMDRYDENKNVTMIKKFRLANGQETNLIEFAPVFDSHISCRNFKRPGWCFISTFDFVQRLTDDAKSWLPFEDEIFALNLSGAGEVQRIAHHHSRRYSPATPDSDTSVYWAEPHATVSPSGTRILFGSNWRDRIESEASVDSYVVDWR